MKLKEHRAVKAMVSHPPKYWHVFALLAIVLVAYWVRLAPARFDEIQDLDSYYMLRLSEYAATHGLTLPAVDDMRFYPTGVNPYEADFPGPVFIPAMMHIAMDAVGIKMHFITFAILFPAFMGALAVAAMYLFSSQLFSRRTSLIISFFFATVPAFMTRTTAGVIEKECIGGVFILLTMWLFLLSYKAKSQKKAWIYGILSGLSFAVLGLSWGGSRIVCLLLPAYAMIMMLANRDVNRLVPSYIPTALLGALIPQLYPYHVGLISATMLPILMVCAVLAIRVAVERLKLVKDIRVVVPAMLIGGVVILLVGSVFYDPFTHLLNDAWKYVFFDHGVLGNTVAEQLHGDWATVLGSTASAYTSAPLASFTHVWIFSFLGLVVMAVTMASDLYKKKAVNPLHLILILWFLIGLWSVFYMVRLVIFFSFPAAMLAGFMFGFLFDRLAPLAKGEIKGLDRLMAFGAIAICASGTLYVLHTSLLTPLAGWLTQEMVLAVALNVCIILGLFVFFKDRVSKDFSFLMLLAYACMAVGLWYGFSSVSSAGYVSLLVGPPLFFSLVWAALFVKKKANAYSLAASLLAVFMAYVICVNISNAYNYGNALSPIFCFPRDNQKCLILHDDGHTYDFVTENQPWHQAAEFFVKNTTVGSSILSWWDFGYWFQTRCQRPSIADGGNINASIDTDIARWFTSHPQNWTQFEPWLDTYRPSYILMDYTLPGKYGAISSIASEGAEIKGMQQFPFTRTLQQGNKTIYEFSFASSTADGVPINTSLFIPFDGQSISGTPQIVISYNDQVLQQSYVNEYCSQFGIMQLGEATDKTMPGCIAITGFGVFYIPQDVEYTIFTSLMFMDGAGLPVKKVFDNDVIKIYETKYAVPLNATNAS